MEKSNHSEIPETVYESPKFGLLGAFDYTSDKKKRDLDKLTNTLKKIIPGMDLIEITNLERLNHLTIFKKINAVFSIEILSGQHSKVTLILPTGILKEVIPTYSEELNDKYLSTYNMETAVIGVAIPKNAEITKFTATPLINDVKNISELTKVKAETQSKIDFLLGKETKIQRSLEILEIRAQTLSDECTSREKTLSFLSEEIKNKESQVSGFDSQIARLVEQRSRLDKNLSEIKNDIDIIKKERVVVNDDLNLSKSTVNNLELSISKLKQEAMELNQKKSLFDNELSGFNIEGKKQSKIYIFISAVILVLLSFSVYVTINSGLEFLNHPKDQNMLDILISRIPLTVGISLVISMCFGMAYFLINQAIRINSDRMKFIKASIIAKDMWSATETAEDLSAVDRERLRQQAKIQLITKIFEENNTSREQEKKALQSLIDGLVSKLK